MKKKERTLSLYNAVNGSHYTDHSMIKIMTIREVMCPAMHNDVSFLISNVMNLFEQQSTYTRDYTVRDATAWRYYYF